MLKGPIPPHIDPRKLADRDAILQGEWPVAQFSRLCEQLVSDAGSVQARLEFGRDEQGLIVMRGELEVEVQMVCQRCLEPASLPVHCEFVYAVLREGASADSLPKSYDALEVGEEPLDLLELVEDELLLALPIVPAHEPDACQHPAGYAAAPEPSVNEVPRSNPFDVLAQLKRDPNV
ncbi:YceD family protein [Pseudomonas stutzeri]|nr:YceD family protein [Stutzerimonas stutzeri]